MLGKRNSPIELVELEKTFNLQSDKKLLAGSSSPSNFASSAGRHIEEKNCKTSPRTIFGGAVHDSNCDVCVNIAHK